MPRNWDSDRKNKNTGDINPTIKSFLPVLIVKGIVVKINTKKHNKEKYIRRLYAIASKALPKTAGGKRT